MASTIASLVERLQPDTWRAQNAFCSEMQSALDTTLNFRGDNVEEVSVALNDWIRRYQPCLFGRIAAKQSAITYCLISEDSLYGDEAALRDYIHIVPTPAVGKCIDSDAAIENMAKR